MEMSESALKKWNQEGYTGSGLIKSLNLNSLVKTEVRIEERH